jgi:hypothetical protein
MFSHVISSRFTLILSSNVFHFTVYNYPSTNLTANNYASETTKLSTPVCEIFQVSTGHPNWSTMHFRSNPDMPERQGSVATDFKRFDASLPRT